ncbi:conserved hypothetical protein [Verticillium alfalfae VaMs.102]|uniref:Uncharacterized protein n=1 Tax=Verticillium alfalfae (strain VaMs.102 / ATCC MYA-4576 / FGSC 10136) TaxID=526221 RepID=C9S769_VERA1|nr:conserved hypothetical protein [Verticillium alfalfae VaMs.102]EEY14654.1 conserved hypothetical protein [Verticillium alfalfae VaMs.102]
MACHQAHNIPWNVLASNFKHVAAHRGVEHTNLYPRFKQHQGKEIQYFINAFCSNVTAHTRVELRKFGDEAQPSADADAIAATQSHMHPDAILLTDETVERIKHSVHGCAEIYWCDGEPGLDWTTVPLPFRRAGAFLLGRGEPGDGADDGREAWRNGPGAFVSLEIFKLLLLHGEMAVLRRICRDGGSRARAAWLQGWERHYDAHGDQNACGWGFVPKLALKAYLCLNLLLCFPPLHDDGRDGRRERDEGRAGARPLDYRDTRCYQHTLRECCLTDAATTTAALPHQHFFGIPRGVYARYGYGSAPAAYLTDQYPSRERPRFPYGVLPFGDFIHLEGAVPHQPSVPDVLYVRWCLCRLGLPTELAIEVMDFAGYVPQRRLPVAHDPFHMANREELRRYLNYCWTVIVRTDMLGTWLGYDVPWDRLVAEQLMQLVGYGPSNPVNICAWKEVLHRGV